MPWAMLYAMGHAVDHNITLEPCCPQHFPDFIMSVWRSAHDYEKDFRSPMRVGQQPLSNGAAEKKSKWDMVRSVLIMTHLCRSGLPRQRPNLFSIRSNLATAALWQPGIVWVAMHISHGRTAHICLCPCLPTEQWLQCPWLGSKIGVPITFRRAMQVNNRPAISNGHPQPLG